MKYLIISDIHGSSKYLEMLIKKEVDFDKLIILGDILYHGPRNDLPNGHNPKEVMEILNSIKDKIIAVRGNCDAKIDLDVLEFKIENHKWITIGDKDIFLTHGDVYSKDSLIDDEKEYVMLYGHYHINQLTQVNNVMAINVGSISLPKDGYHSYGVINEGVLTLYDLVNEKIIFSVSL